MKFFRVAPLAETWSALMICSLAWSDELLTPDEMAFKDAWVKQALLLLDQPRGRNCGLWLWSGQLI